MSLPTKDRYIDEAAEEAVHSLAGALMENLEGTLGKQVTSALSQSMQDVLPENLEELERLIRQEAEQGRTLTLREVRAVLEALDRFVKVAARADQVAAVRSELEALRQQTAALGTGTKEIQETLRALWKQVELIRTTQAAFDERLQKVRVAVVEELAGQERRLADREKNLVKIIQSEFDLLDGRATKFLWVLSGLAAVTTMAAITIVVMLLMNR